MNVSALPAALAVRRTTRLPLPRDVPPLSTLAMRGMGRGRQEERAFCISFGADRLALRWMADLPRPTPRPSTPSATAPDARVAIRD